MTEDRALTEAIADIEALFPADSPYQESRVIGERLLAQAKMEVEGWRSESKAVLFRYAELCRAEENRTSRTLLAPEGLKE